MIKAVIFDIDGTLLDSVDLHAKAWQEAFEKFGKHIPFKEIRQQIGKGGDQLMPDFLTDEEMKQFGKELEEYRGELFKRKYLPHVKAFPRVRELFQFLKANDKRIALASSAKEDELKRYKQIADIEDLVDEESSSDDAERSKPHPDIFQATLKSLSIEANEAVVVGDSPYDAEEAGKIGLRTIGVLSGGFPREELVRAGCIAIFNDVADLLDHYDETIIAQE
jgi:HAD superfamily hydrolase (TIGR01549 family)